MMMRVDSDIRRAYRHGAVALVEEAADLDRLDDAGFDISLPVFAVGQVATLAGVHPQTLRQYDRLGIVVPQRTSGGARRYSLRDVSRLCDAQRLSQEESVNLAGILRILDLSEENRQLRRQIRRLRRGPEGTVFASNPDGEIVEVSGAVSVRVRSPRVEGARGDVNDRREGDPVVSSSTALVVWRSL